MIAFISTKKKTSQHLSNNSQVAVLRTETTKHCTIIPDLFVGSLSPPRRLGLQGSRRRKGKEKERS